MTPSFARRLALLCTLLLALPGCRQVARYAAATELSPDARVDAPRVADLLRPHDMRLPDEQGLDIAADDLLRPDDLDNPDACVDIDGDGVCDPLDCDDNDPSSYPGAPELCDGKDNNCNTVPDDGRPCDTDCVNADCVGASCVNFTAKPLGATCNLDKSGRCTAAGFCCKTCIDKTGKCVAALSPTQCGTGGKNCDNCAIQGMSCSAAGICKP